MLVTHTSSIQLRPHCFELMDSISRLGAAVRFIIEARGLPNASNRSHWTPTRVVCAWAMHKRLCRGRTEQHYCGQQQLKTGGSSVREKSERTRAREGEMCGCVLLEGREGQGPRTTGQSTPRPPPFPLQHGSNAWIWRVIRYGFGPRMMPPVPTPPTRSGPRTRLHE